jgi:CTP-dependent riboflavin kinase
MTGETRTPHFRVSFNSARRGVEELADAGVLTRRKVDRGTTANLAGDVFELLAFTERRIASRMRS